MASLYTDDKGKYKKNMRILLKEIENRKEERYVLFCTIAQNKSIGMEIMKALLNKDGTTVNEYSELILDLSFECQDLDIDELVKQKLNVRETFSLNSYDNSDRSTNFYDRLHTPVWLGKCGKRVINHD